jgi:hypothetical protein
MSRLAHGRRPSHNRRPSCFMTTELTLSLAVPGRGGNRMMICVVLARFLGVMSGVRGMAVGYVSVVAGLLVVA